MLTHAQVINRISNRLNDSTNVYFADTLITEYMEAVLKRPISQQVPLIATQRHPGDRPVPTRGAYTTDGTTRDIILSDWDNDDMVEPGLSQEDGVEYPIDKSPKEYVNHTRRGRILSLHLDSIPASGKDVYVYPRRLHVLQEAIGTTDTAGAVKTAAAVAATSLALDSLGTGTINKYTKLTIAGDTTEYMVKATATIATNEATATITPGLVAAAAAAAVVTLALADSTLSPGLEEVLIEWASAELLSDYAIGLLPKVPAGSDQSKYIQKAELMLAKARQALADMTIPCRYVRHPR